MTDINKVVGKRIYEFRKKKGLTQEGLAFEANLHRAYVGQIERGEKAIGVKNLQKIAKALNVKMSKLLGE
ncbi:MAG: helix-turn-helix transcriptional regulator [Candidatus Omnitrophica bacterium]|nr:helix-turn-helix transcriptional regulator [Candidatus Omnitrophota bacterium]